MSIEEELSKSNRQGTHAMTLHVQACRLYVCVSVVVAGGCVHFLWWGRLAVEQMQSPPQTSSDAANRYVGHSSWEEKAQLSFRNFIEACRTIGCFWL